VVNHVLCADGEDRFGLRSQKHHNRNRDRAERCSRVAGGGDCTACWMMLSMFGT
jgi:hypothetical protein